MAKRNRVQRSKAELKQELAEQLLLLQNSCRSFDSGLEVIGKHIALSLRVLLYQHGSSRSLLDQLGLRAGKFFDTAGPLSPDNLVTECNLVAMRFSNLGGESEGRYVPSIEAGGSPLKRYALFVNWWNDPVLKDIRGRTFSRMELVTHVADTDGGAHVDPGLDEAYMALSRQNSLGWTFGNDGISIPIDEQAGHMASPFKGRIELACMRQIAHELLSTIHQTIPEFREYAEPVIPANKN